MGQESPRESVLFPVTQDILPWTWGFSPNLVINYGFMTAPAGGWRAPAGAATVALGGSNDAEFERRVAAEYSYGRQLGRIGEALAVLLSRVDLEDLAPKEQAAIDDLKTMLDRIAALREG